VFMLCSANDARAQTNCSFNVTPTLDFGSNTGTPIPQIDAVATISVTCANLLSGVVNHRVCISLPPGSAGVSLSQRQLAGPEGNRVNYQLYTNSGRTTVWGEYGADPGPVAVDFMNLTLGAPQTINVTVYGRIFGNQTGMIPGVYQSVIQPVVRRTDFLLILVPSCQNVTANAQTLSPITASFEIDSVCTVQANPLDFGTVSALTGHSATTNLAVQCTAGGPYTVALDGGTVTGNVGDRRMQAGSGSTVRYELYRDGARTQAWGSGPGQVYSGTGTGATQSIPVYGWVPAQGPVEPGKYTDQVTVTVSF
jgi:spore coat protein U-like protein